jgi:hypothetical protein
VIITDVTKTWLDLRTALEGEIRSRTTIFFYIPFFSQLIMKRHVLDMVAGFCGRRLDFIPLFSQLTAAWSGFTWKELLDRLTNLLALKLSRQTRESSYILFSCIDLYIPLFTPDLMT